MNKEQTIKEIGDFQFIYQNGFIGAKKNKPTKIKRKVQISKK